MKLLPLHLLPHWTRKVASCFLFPFVTLLYRPISFDGSSWTRLFQLDWTIVYSLLFGELINVGVFVYHIPIHIMLFALGFKFQYCCGIGCDNILVWWLVTISIKLDQLVLFTCRCLVNFLIPGYYIKSPNSLPVVCTKVPNSHFKMCCAGSSGKWR